MDIPPFPPKWMRDGEEGEHKKDLPSLNSHFLFKVISGFKKS